VRKNDSTNWKKLNDENGGTYEYFARIDKRKYETRFLDSSGNELSDESEYNTKLTDGEQVYIACFVGCTYHCG